MNRKNLQIITLILTSAIITSGCINQISNNKINMNISSPNFENDELIPIEFTCQGKDISPELNIGEPPHGTKSFALIMDDPDATNGTWTHWLIWNIPKETTVIPKNVGTDFAIQGNNSWPKLGYGGPCPPTGTHRYFFRLFALNQELDLPAGATRNELEEAMKDRIINQEQLMGIVKAKKNSN